MLRIYRLKDHTNQSKIGKLTYIRAEYIKVAKTLGKMQWSNLYSEGKFSKTNIYKPIQTPMTERYKDVCKRQVDGILKSYLSNLKNRIKDTIGRSSLCENDKKELYKINRYGHWFDRSKYGKYDPMLLKVARKVFKNAIGRQKLPSFSNINLSLNNKVVSIQASNSKGFDYWARISSFERGKFIWIPMQTNRYFESVDGIVKDFLQVNFKSNVLAFNLLKDVRKPLYEPNTDKIALDLGLANLLTSNLGDQFGIQWMKKLKAYDSKIQALAKKLQKQGIYRYRSESSRYRKLVFKMRAFVKNEVNRIVNRIIKLYRPSKIYLESLDFNNQNLSRSLNRLIGNFGKSALKAKMESVSEMYGIELVYVNPAYTSQTCSKCDHLEKSSRKSQSRFECRGCGAKMNADVNAGRNILRWDVFGKYATKEKIKKSILGKHAFA